MSPSILVVGATGNTAHRLIGLTRDKNGKAATELAKLPNVEFEEKDWVLIDAEWLKSHSVQRIFIASHNGPTQFAEESLFLHAALKAGVEYVVRISTTAENVAPDSKAWYGRTHWAVETMLEQPPFAAMKWTSIQPNVFIAMFLPAFQAWLKEYRESGKKETLKVMMDEKNGVAVVDGYEVGLIAGHLLAEEDPSPHSGKKYCIVSPEDANGEQLVKVLEKHAGTTIDDVVYRDTSFVDGLRGAWPATMADNVANALKVSFEGGTSVKDTPTSPEVLELYAPKRHLVEALDQALGQM